MNPVIEKIKKEILKIKREEQRKEKKVLDTQKLLKKYEEDYQSSVDLRVKKEYEILVLELKDKGMDMEDLFRLINNQPISSDENKEKEFNHFENKDEEIAEIVGG